MSFFKPSEGCPTSLVEVLVGPWLFAFFGLMIGMGVIRQFQQNGKLPTWWLGSFAPTILGMVLGIQRFSFRFDTLYFSSISSRKLDWAHFAAPIFPLASVVLVLILIKKQIGVESKKVY